MKKQNDCLEINTFIQSLHQSLKVSAGVLDPQLPCSECRLNILQKTFSTDQPVINESDWKIGAKKLQISITNVKYKHASKSTEIHHFWCLSFFRKKSIPKAHLSPTRPSPCVLSETELCWFVFCRTRGLLYKGSSVDDVSEISVAEDTMCQSTTTSLPQVRTPTTTGGRSYVNLHLWGSGPNSDAFLCAVLPCSGAPRGALGLSRNRCVRRKFTNETLLHFFLWCSFFCDSGSDRGSLSKRIGYQSPAAPTVVMETTQLDINPSSPSQSSSCSSSSSSFQDPF